MKKRVTRRQIQAWLAPIRRCFAEIKTGEVDSMRGYAVTRLTEKDSYARTDYCIAGFRALIDRLCPNLDYGSILRVEKKLAAGTPLTVAEIDDALSFLHRCEDALIKHTVAAVKDAVLTEQISIELDELNMRNAA